MPDLLVIDQQNQPQPNAGRRAYGSNQNAPTPVHTGIISKDHHQPSSNYHHLQPETASLINLQPVHPAPDEITFECIIGFDRRKDKNLIVKWHHEDRQEPIYQWIPELNKRSIAANYRPHIVPIVSSTNSNSNLNNNNNNNENNNRQSATHLSEIQPTPNTNNLMNGATNDSQVIEAGFKLVNPSKELGGK